MAIIDVFNGDADGICALHQLRLTDPQTNTLVTGVKRDINLLSRVDASAGDKVTVLDISLDKNREGLTRLLGKGVHVSYFDHHFAGEIPENDNLQAYINTAPNVCTGLLVNQYLNNKHLSWAVTAAYGDNLFESAKKAAAPLNLNETQLALLKELGTYINYNGYGTKPDDLFYPPEELYRQIKPYQDPFDFIHESTAFTALKEGYAEDIKNAERIKAAWETDNFAIYILPNAKWANRVSGVYANKLAQQSPQRAHAILSTHVDDSDNTTSNNKNNKNSPYVVSVRAPIATKIGADEVCRQFETGGGRKAAAGINQLPHNDYDRFISVMSSVFKS